MCHTVSWRTSLPATKPPTAANTTPMSAYAKAAHAPNIATAASVISQRGNITTLAGVYNKITASGVHQ